METGKDVTGVNQGIAGHGSFFQDAGLSSADAEKATEWVRKHVDKRTVDLGERMDDIRDHMWELEKDGQIIVHRITDAHKPIDVQTLFGWNKRIPTMQLWHHKSCGQCGNISPSRSDAFKARYLDVEFLVFPPLVGEPKRVTVAHASIAELYKHRRVVVQNAD